MSEADENLETVLPGIICNHWLFFSKDVFALDSVSKRIESYHGVRKVDVLISISIEYHKEVLIKEIERNLVDKREGSLSAKEIPNVVA